MIALFLVLLGVGRAPAQRVVATDPVVKSNGVVTPGGRVEVADEPAVGALVSGAPRAAGTSAVRLGLAFDGMRQDDPTDLGFDLYGPSDTHHAVGRGQGPAGRIVHVTLKGVAIHDKTGAVVADAVGLDDVLAGMGVGGLSAPGVRDVTFDPRVLHDPHSDRFFLVMVDGRSVGVPPRNTLHVMVSRDGTPDTLSGADWILHSATAATRVQGSTAWFDYPMVAVDASRLVIAGNLFNHLDEFVGVKIRVYGKPSLLLAHPVFNDIDRALVATPGIFSPQPAQVFGSTRNGDFYLVNRAGPEAFRLWQVTGAGGSASLAPGSPSVHAWNSGSFDVAGAPQLGDGLNDEPRVATLSPRVMHAVLRPDGNGRESVWLALTADVAAGDGGATEIVWFQIDPNVGGSTIPGLRTTPAIVQAGLLDGSGQGDWVYLPSVAVDRHGDLVIVYNESSFQRAIEVRVAHRLASSPPGSLDGVATLGTSAGEFDDHSGAPVERWGDYGSAVVDPDDDETFWLAQPRCVEAPSALGDDAAWGVLLGRLDPLHAVVFADGFETGTTERW